MQGFLAWTCRGKAGNTAAYPGRSSGICADLNSWIFHINGVYDTSVGNRRFRITYVFPPNWIFDEVRFCYERAAARLSGITIRHDYYYWTPEKPEWDDPDLAVIFLCNIPWVVPPGRRAKFIFQYVESVGDPRNMVPEQRKWLEYYMTRAQEPDLFLGGTPTVRDFWAPLARRSALTPLGYNPEIMGSPDWTRAKTYDVGFCGVNVGRREWILPALQRRLGNRFLNITAFGRARNDAFDFCKAMLYIGHSEERAFADMRLWSAVATSAALVTEDRDAWPAIPGKHYLTLPHAQKENPDEFVDAVEKALKEPLVDIAKAMHKDLSVFTTEECITKFTIPAIEAIA